MIGLHEVAKYLVDRNIIAASSVTGRSLEITPLSGRNYNCLVRDSHLSIVLKQGVWLDDSRKAFRTEQAIFSELVPSFSSDLQSQFPKVVLNDNVTSVLAVEYVANARPLAQALQEVPAQAYAFGQRLGAFFGRLHIEGAALSRLERKGWLTDGPPWALGLHRPSASHFRLMTPGGYHCLKALQRLPNLCEAIQRERENWRAETVVHGDVKSDNLLFVLAPHGTVVKLVVIDWELAQLGDPAWDIAGFFGEVLVSWVYSRRAFYTEPHDGELAARLGPVHLAIVEGYLAGYALAAKLSLSASLFERAFVLSGARLVQFAVEYAQHQTETPAECVQALHLAEQLMCQRGWARSLLRPQRPSVATSFQ